jgi:molybdate transport system substrate-binding protein
VTRVPQVRHTRSMITLRRARAGVLLLALTLSACGGGTGSGDGGADAGSDGGGEQSALTVLAAASLTDVFTDLKQEFEADRGVAVTFSFGSSTDLAAQAADGAPGDVLATADTTSMAVARDAGVTGEVSDFATNVLVLVTRPGNPLHITSLDDLDGTTWVRCADEAPCGRVAAQVLDAAGVTAEPASLEDDVRATLDKVTSGEADAGLVYATDALAAGDAVTTVRVPEAADAPTTYDVATLEQAGDDDLAQAWVDLLLSEDGRRILDDAGFTVPGAGR